MGHVDEGDPDLALDALEFELHDVTQLEVQRSEGLVEQQGAGVVHQGAGQRNPLLLTAGKLRGFAFREVGQPNHLEHFVDALGDRRFVLALAARSVGDVVPHGHVREQCVVLEDSVDMAFMRCHSRNVDAFQTDGTFGRVFESGDHPQGGGLPAPGWPEQGEELAGTDREISVRHRDVVLEALGDVIDLNDRFPASPAGVARRGLQVGGASLGQDPSSSKIPAVVVR